MMKNRVKNCLITKVEINPCFETDRTEIVLITISENGESRLKFYFPEDKVKLLKIMEFAKVSIPKDLETRIIREMPDKSNTETIALGDPIQDQFFKLDDKSCKCQALHNLDII